MSSIYYNVQKCRYKKCITLFAVITFRTCLTVSFLIFRLHFVSPIGREKTCHIYNLHQICSKRKVFDSKKTIEPTQERHNRLRLPSADLDKERPQANPLVRPLPILHLHDWRKMEVCLINFNKSKDDEGCLKLILQYSEMEYN